MRSGFSDPRYQGGGYTADAHPLESIGLGLLGCVVAACALLWAAGEASGRIFGGSWPAVGLSQMGSVLVALPRHAGEPADAWPPGARDLIPGPAAFYGTFAAVFVPFAAGALLLISRLRDRHEVPGTARWARPRDLRALRVRANTAGRLILGRAAGRLVAAESRQSAIVIGPTQTGKTTGFAIPAILEWKGPVVATSIKTDLLRDTIAARSAITGARTFVYDPTGSTGLPSDGWTPLIEGLTWQGAQRVAEWLARGARTSGMASDTGDFWYGATAKLLAPILLAAACSGGSMAQVVAWVDSMDTKHTERALTRKRRTGGHRRARGHRTLGRPNQGKRLRDRADRAQRLRRSRRPHLRDVSRSPRRQTARRRLAYRIPLRTRPRAAPPPAALRDARPGDHRARV